MRSARTRMREAPPVAQDPDSDDATSPPPKPVPQQVAAPAGFMRPSGVAAPGKAPVSDGKRTRDGADSKTSKKRKTRAAEE
jgi:hypothetical protein